MVEHSGPEATVEGERAHLERLSALLELEAAEESARAKARSERLTPADAEAAGISLVDLVLVDAYSGLGGLDVLKLRKRNQTLRLPWTRIGVGSPVVLTDQADPEVSVRGVVASKKADAISVATSKDATELDEDASYRIDLSGDEITSRRQQAALRQAIGASADRVAELRGIFSGRLEARFEPEPAPPPAGLNPAQARAVALGLRARDVALIHGPPGTGKTKTLVALIEAAVARGETVLATAPSNLAVDNVLERLVAAGVPVVRLGHPARVLASLLEHTLNVQVEASEDMKLAKRLMQEAFALRRKADKPSRTRMDRKARAALRFEAKALLKDARRLERQASARVLDRARVVCATTSVDPELLAGRRFDLVAIDEAAQSTEPGSWPPILLGDRVVLAGDHRQLPPTVVSPEAAKQGFSVSLFERLMGRLGEEASVALSVQYRMHEAIMGFSNAELYEGRLEAAPAVRTHRLCDLEGVQTTASTEAPLELVDTAGAGWTEALEPDGESRHNEDEAAHIVHRVEELRAAGVPDAAMGIITPYAAQARLLRTLLPDEALEIDTVDGFQGREKEAILISFVRSNDEGDVGFLADVRRTNVALTRARRKLLLVGDSATLGAHPFYADLLSYIERAGWYRTVWEL